MNALGNRPLNPSRDPAPERGSIVEQALDAERLRVALQRLLPACRDQGSSIHRVHVHTVRRNASRRRQPDVACFRIDVELRGPDASHAHVQAWSARVARDDLVQRAASVSHSCVVPELQLVLQPWPYDDAMPQLVALNDTLAAQPWLGARAQRVQTLRWVPGERALLRYEGLDRDGRSMAVLAKTFADDRGEALQDRFAWFTEQSRVDDSTPKAPETLGYDAARRTLWQRESSAVALDARRNATQVRALGHRLAHAAATVHRAPVALASAARRDADHWQREIDARAKKLVRACPDLAPSVQALTQALHATATPSSAWPVRVLHGDLHLGQFRLDGSRLVMFDLDEMCLGDPYEDLASLMARLDDGVVGMVLSEAFVQAWLHAMNEDLVPQRLAWHLALQHVLQASRAFVFQVPEWRGLALQRLQRAQACLDRPHRWATPGLEAA